MSKKPTTVTEYINSAPEEARVRLQEMLACLRKAAPGAKEEIKWRVPALSYDWILFTFAAHKKHISLYPHPRTIRAFENDLANFQTSKSTIRFPLDQPLPTTLITRIAEFRVREALEKGIKWM